MHDIALIIAHMGNGGIVWLAQDDAVGRCGREEFGPAQQSFVTIEAGLQMTCHGNYSPGQFVRWFERQNVMRQDAIGPAQLAQSIVQGARIAGGQAIDQRIIEINCEINRPVLRHHAPPEFSCARCLAHKRRRGPSVQPSF